MQSGKGAKPQRVVTAEEQRSRETEQQRLMCNAKGQSRKAFLLQRSRETEEDF